jgi:hypothetical protein
MMGWNLRAWQTACRSSASALLTDFLSTTSRKQLPRSTSPGGGARTASAPRAARQLSASTASRGTAASPPMRVRGWRLLPSAPAAHSVRAQERSQSGGPSPARRNAVCPTAWPPGNLVGQPRAGTCHESGPSSQNSSALNPWGAARATPALPSSSYGPKQTILEGSRHPRECSRVFFSPTMTTLRSS